MTTMALGRTLYLHKMGSGFAPRVLITAHGGIEKKKQKTFTLPRGVTVRFFTDHGTVLPDPGVNSVLEGLATAEEITGGQCYNYELSKYQGRHGNGKETYESIGRNLAHFKDLEDNNKKLINPVVQKATYQGVDSLSKLEQAFWKRAVKSMQEYGQLYKDECDVITIRNRALMKIVTLKDVISAALKVNPDYAVFECSFCRSFM